MRRRFLSFTSQSRCKSSVSVMDWRQAVADFRHKTNDTNALLSPEDVHSVVRVCTQSDRTREAVDALRRGEKHGVLAPLQSHIAICCSWIRKGQAERALAMMPQLCDQFKEHFQKMRGDQSTVYDALLSEFKAQGDWRSTHTTIAQMHTLGITPSLRAFRVLMLTAAKARRKDVLMTTIDFVEKKFPNAWTDVAFVTAVCQALVDVGENERVMEIYAKLQKEWVHTKANTMLFNQFLVAAIRSEDNEKMRLKHKNLLATDIFNQMQEAQQASPDDFTFAACMIDLEKRREWARILDLFKTMLQVEECNHKAEKLKNSVINALSCSVVIRALHNIHHVSHLKQSKTNDKVKNKRTPYIVPKAHQRKLKQDLSIVLGLLRTVDLRNINHASTLIDTLDEFELFTPARRTFQRVLDEGIIRKTPWRLKDGFEIDLHTFSRGVAKCAIVLAFDEIRRFQQDLSDVSCAGTTPLQDLRIITGSGRRSKVYMKPVLKQAVTDLLTKSCRPPLWPSLQPTNPGVLLVRRNALRKWLLKGGAVRYF